MSQFALHVLLSKLYQGILDIDQIVVTYSSWLAPSRLGIIALAVLAYFAIPRRTWQNIILLSLGGLFTLTVSHLYFLVMLFSGIQEWLIAGALFRSTNPKHRVILVWTSVIANVLLFTFVLLEPHQSLIDVLFGSWKQNVPLLYGWVVNAAFLAGFPVFCKMTLTLDIYNRRLKSAPGLLSSLVYVGLFSRSWASSTDRARDTIPQLDVARTWNWHNAEESFWLMLSGLLKFSLFHALGEYPLRLVSEDSHGLSLYAGDWLLTMGLFLSISGLTDISRSLNILFGIRIAPNFDAPLLSTNIGDFWRRWNSTLCLWLYEEVFSRINFALRHRGTLGLAIACLGTFLVSGLAHGLSAGLLYDSLFEGSAVFAYFVWRNKFRKWAKSVGNPSWIPVATWFATVNFFVIGNGLFLDDSLAGAGSRFLRLFTSSASTTSVDPIPWARLGVIFVISAVVHTLPRFKGGDAWPQRLRGSTRAGVSVMGLGLIAALALW